MAAVGGILRKAIPIVCLVASALALKNVYEDNSEVTRKAEQVACGKVGCSVRKIEEHRSALSQRFVFQTSLETQQTQSVECERSMIFFGDYECR